EFIKKFNNLARYHHRHKVWSDFVTCIGIELHQPFNKDSELESLYISIMKQYEKEDRFEILNLGRMLIDVFEETGFCDLLGVWGLRVKDPRLPD
ncbi:MAG: hypothetical protein V7735_25830, partial [Photobacterium frigidiphilum]|uniref:hypothetical protein n=1 Tax=Photobacterium frigidiphilum TaxID=264736 RepID=UPI003B5D5FD6